MFDKCYMSDKHGTGKKCVTLKNKNLFSMTEILYVSKTDQNIFELYLQNNCH